jgi:hypothetical protein
MKSLLSILTVSLFSASYSHAVIFGNDDRDEVRKSPVMQKLARATAVQVALNFIEVDSQGRLNLDFQPLTESGNWNLCPDERFAHQPTSPIACTAFLIAPDLMITAGHCAVNWSKVQNEVTPLCSAFGWLFDYQTDQNDLVEIKGLAPERLVHCKKVIYANQEVVFDKATKLTTFHEDIALIQIDRAITDREPMKLSHVDALLGESLSAIGYPLGLPAKSSQNAVVFDISDPDYLRTDLDVSGGNSGSPVFNNKAEVIGVVVRAFPDPETKTDHKQNCEHWYHCNADRQTCDTQEKNYVHSTEVQRIKAIFPYVN